MLHEVSYFLSQYEFQMGTGTCAVVPSIDQKSKHEWRFQLSTELFIMSYQENRLNKSFMYFQSVLTNYRRTAPNNVLLSMNATLQPMVYFNDITITLTTQRRTVICLCVKSLCVVWIAQSIQLLATGWTVLGSKPGKGKRFVLPKNSPHQLWGPTTHLFNGYWGSFPEVERPERQVYHSPPSSAEVKNSYRYATTPIDAFMACKGTTLPS